MPWADLPGGLIPDLAVAAIVVLAVRLERVPAILLAALAGLVDDALAGTPFGVRTLVLVVVAWLVGSFASAVDAEPLPMRLLLLGSASVGASLIEVVVLRQLYPASPLIGATLLEGLFTRALATSVLGALACAPFVGLSRTRSAW